MLKKISLFLAGVVALLAAVVFLLPPLLDWNLVKSQIVGAASKATGYDIAVEGDLQIPSVFPQFRLRADNVTLSNRDEDDASELLASDQVVIELSALSLLMGELDLERLKLGSPRVLVEIDADGHSNWDTGDRPPAVEDSKSGQSESLPFDEIRLGQATVETAQIIYRNLGSGQTLKADKLDLTAKLPGLGSPLQLSGNGLINRAPLQLTASLDSPRQVLDGGRGALRLNLDSKLIEIAIDAALSSQPFFGIDGTIDASIASYAQFATWIGRQPAAAEDPGPLRLQGRFSNSATTFGIDSFTVAGDDWKIESNGELNFGAAPPQIRLTVRGDAVDLDQYSLREPSTMRSRAQRSHREGADSDLDLDSAVNVSGLREVEGTIHLSLAGLKAGGVEIGGIALTAELANGMLTTTLGELQLYGGKLLGEIKLDGSGPGLQANSAMAVDKVNIGAMSRAAGSDIHIAGTANGVFKLETSGATPRDLLNQLTGHLFLGLGEGETLAAGAQTLTKANVEIQLPGPDERPYVLARAVYGGKTIDLDVESAPVSTILEGNTFDLDASLTSELLKAAFKGNIFQQPIFSLDGDINLETSSAGRLAAWLGSSLDPDPGAVRVTAQLESDGSKGRITDATLKGKGLDAELFGEFEITETESRFRLTAKTGRLDLARYMPETGNDEGNSVDEPAQEASQDFSGLLDSLPNEPFDLATLRSIDADVEIDSAGLLLPDFSSGPLQLGVVAKGGKVDAKLNRMDIYGGKVSGAAVFDGTQDNAQASLDLTVTDLDLATLLPEPGLQPVSGKLTASGTGGDLRSLISALQLSAEARSAALQLDPTTGIQDLSVALSTKGAKETLTAKVDGKLSTGTPARTHNLAALVAFTPIAKILANEDLTISGTAELGETEIQVDASIADPFGEARPSITASAKGNNLQEIGALFGADAPSAGPYKLKLHAEPEGLGLHISDFSLQAGSSQISANLFAKTSEAKPEISGTISAERIDVAELTAGNATANKTEGVEAETPAATAENEKWIIPAEPFPFELLNQVEIDDLKIDVASLRLTSEMEIKDLDAGVRLTGGRLTIAPFKGRLYEGEINAELDTAATSPPTIQLKGKLSDLNYGEILKAYQVTDGVEGQIDVGVDFKAEGESPRAMASSLNGTIDADAEKGNIDQGMLKILSFGSGSILGPLLGDDGTGNLNCIVVAMNFENGLGTSEVQYIDTNDFAASGEGQIDLKTETLDFIYKPSTRQISLARLAVPFSVKGPMKSPSVNVDPAGTLVSAAKTAGKVISFVNPLVGLGVLAVDELINREGGCVAARKIAHGDIATPSPEKVEEQPRINNRRDN